MIKIIALNDGEPTDSDEQEEVVATREAQETIAESEYIRAIRLKSQGKVDLSLHILNELLETQVLNENIAGTNNEKLWFIKYNCHKNIAMILEERKEFELALQHYVSAILIDNTDVYTLNKFGLVALKLNSIDLAEYAFENCLARNASHWRASEGMLVSLYANSNVLGTFKQALQMCRDNPGASRAAQQMVQELATWFKRGSAVLEVCGGDNANDDKYTQTDFKLLFDSTKEYEEEKEVNLEEKPAERFKDVGINSLNWTSMGKFILDVYTLCRETGQSLFTCFNIEDYVGAGTNEGNESPLNKPATEEEGTGGSNSESEQLETIGEKSPADVESAQPMDCNNDDSDPSAKAPEAGGESNKSKPRRRCSDLHFLEQWGWHKNRRYSSRKKAEREEPDDSLNSYLRRIFASHMGNNIEVKWPFSEDSKIEEATSFQCALCKTSREGSTFQKETGEDFDKFLKKLKGEKKDLMVLIYKWLKYVSLGWNKAMPNGVKDLYKAIFGLYMQHFDLKTWNQLTANNYEASFRICLLYLELTVGDANLCSSDMWQQVLHHVCFSISLCNLISNSNSDIYELRLLYLKYLTFNDRGEYKECLGCLEVMSQILVNQAHTFMLHLPNSGAVCLTTNFIESMQNQYRSQIDINSIPRLFETQSWNTLIKIIIKNMESGSNMYENEKWFKDFRIEIEILLQSLWKIHSFDLCLCWSEKCLHYAVSHYLEETKSAYRQKLLADSINFITSYIEAIVLNEGHPIVSHLKTDSLSRLVQNLMRILVYQFDGNFEKNSTHGLELDFKRPWVILHQLILSAENNTSSVTQNSKTEENEDIYELVPNSFSILFTAHEYLGKRQWCSNDNGEFLQYILDNVVFNLKAPIYDNCRDIIYEYLEQVTYCLFKYPQKKARSRHLEDHEASPANLTWPKSIQIFDLYQPEHLPEFNSYKLESISSDMEQLLLKIIALMPKELEPSEFTHNVTQYIDGEDDKPPDETKAFKLPYKIVSLYYLLGDFYFKSRDFVKAIKFYTLDLTANPKRFDSWAGLALSKASKIETKLNGIDCVSTENLWEECEQVLRCFECCITLNRYQTLLWIEYGSFCYTIHSYYSRYLKYNSAKLEMQLATSIEERRNKTLNVAYNCFSLVNSIQNSTPTTNTSDDSSDTNDEMWLCQYMLGKISEKRKEEPNVYLNHYLMAANFLYECNATYPIKINHSNPTTLSVEALEIFYRINAAIIKYVAGKEEIPRNTGDLLRKVLRNLSNSPFAYNKAKVHGNSLNMMKRKQSVQKPKQTGNNNTNTTPDAEVTIVEPPKTKESDTSPLHIEAATQESPRPSTVASSATSSAMSTETSSMESESESNDSAGTNGIKNNSPLTLDELKPIYGMVLQNIEECATRFPEHYKSIYRLIYHYMNSPPAFCNLETCEQLLMGQYKTSLGNVVNGIFYERKNNNLFNGIWRIPSSEIDRPGSFSSHLVKCVNIFIKFSAKTNNHKILIDIATNLYKNPDADKRYIADTARKDLYQQCITYTIQMLKDILEKNMQQRDDMDVLNLMIDIYKIHKKCVKYMNQKEATFTKLLVEAYKFFIKDKVEQIPENCNFLDLAIKLCSQEVTSRKLNEKSNNFEGFKYSTDWLTADTHSRIFNQFRSSTIIPKSSVTPSIVVPEKLETSKPAQPPPAETQLPALNLFAGDHNKALDTKVQDLQQQLKEYYINLLGHSSLNLNLNDLNAKAQNLAHWLPTLSTAATTVIPTETILNPKPPQAKAKSSAKRKKPATPYQRPAANCPTAKGADNLTKDLFIHHENPLLPAYIQGNVAANASPPVNLSQKSTHEPNTQPSFPMEYPMKMGKSSATATTAMDITKNPAGAPPAYQSMGRGINPLSRHPSYNSLSSVGVLGQQPTKTLQEKLAERQKTGQMKELDSSSAANAAAAAASAQSGNKSSDDDVIILE